MTPLDFFLPAFFMAGLICLRRQFIVFFFGGGGVWSRTQRVDLTTKGVTI